MAEPSRHEETQVVDEGIDVGISRLTDDQIQSVINTVIDTETGARLKTYVETCIHCGLCSEACHYYLSHDNDPHYSPVGKVKLAPDYPQTGGHAALHPGHGPQSLGDHESDVGQG